MKGDAALLVSATVNIYKECFVGAARKARLNLWGALLPVLYWLITIGAGIPIRLFLGNLVGGFVIGLLSAAYLAHYVTVLQSTVRNERIGFKESLRRSTDLFSSCISVLFVLWIISFIASRVITGEQHIWIALALNAFLFIGFNSLIECIYLSNSDGFTCFQTALEFMKENAIEWLVPLFCVLGPLILLDPAQTLAGLSLTPGWCCFFFLGRILAYLPFFSTAELVVIAIAVLGVWYYAMIFRGLLFQRLYLSNRRKRIYAAKAA